MHPFGKRLDSSIYKRRISHSHFQDRFRRVSSCPHSRTLCITIFGEPIVGLDEGYAVEFKSSTCTVRCRCSCSIALKIRKNVNSALLFLMASTDSASASEAPVKLINTIDSPKFLIRTIAKRIKSTLFVALSLGKNGLVPLRPKHQNISPILPPTLYSFAELQ